MNMSAGQFRQRRIQTVVTVRNGRSTQWPRRISHNVNNNIVVEHDENYALTKRNTKSILQLGLLNARSVANKAEFILEQIQDNSMGIMAVTETWLKANDDHIVNEICPPGYSFIGAPRPVKKGKTGGGVGFVLSPEIKAENVTHEEFRTFEIVTIKIGSCHPLHLSLIYRPPPSRKKQLETFLSSLCSSVQGDLCVLGDFNVHWEKEDNPITKEFSDIISSLEMKQLVKCPTHKSQHTLDLIMEVPN